MQKQSNSYTCGLFAIAFAMDILNVLSPVDSYFDVSLMRQVLQYLETEELTVSQKTPKRIQATNAAFKVLKA